MTYGPYAFTQGRPRDASKWPIRQLEKTRKPMTDNEIQKANRWGDPILWLLKLVATMGGKNNMAVYIDDGPMHWTAVFCEHDKEPDTFNEAINLGYLRFGHDSDTDDSSISITSAGREYLEAAGPDFNEQVVSALWDFMYSRELAVRGEEMSVGDIINALEEHEDNLCQSDKDFNAIVKRRDESLAANNRYLERARATEALNRELWENLDRVMDHFKAWVADHADEATAETYAAMHCAGLALNRGRPHG